MDLLTVKIVAIVGLGLVSLIFGLIPIKMRKCLFKDGQGAGNKRQVVLSFFLCFGAGVLFAAVMIHMMPEIREGFDRVRMLEKSKGSHDHDSPMPQGLAVEERKKEAHGAGYKGSHSYNHGQEYSAHNSRDGGSHAHNHEDDFEYNEKLDHPQGNDLGSSHNHIHPHDHEESHAHNDLDDHAHHHGQDIHPHHGDQDHRHADHEHHDHSHHNHEHIDHPMEKSLESGSRNHDNIQSHSDHQHLDKHMPPEVVEQSASDNGSHESKKMPTDILKSDGLVPSDIVSEGPTDTTMAVTEIPNSHSIVKRNVESFVNVTMTPERTVEPTETTVSTLATDISDTTNKNPETTKVVDSDHSTKHENPITEANEELLDHTDPSVPQNIDIHAEPSSTPHDLNNSHHSEDAENIELTQYAAHDGHQTQKPINPTDSSQTTLNAGKIEITVPTTMGDGLEHMDHSESQIGTTNSPHEVEHLNSAELTPLDEHHPSSEILEHSDQIDSVDRMSHAEHSDHADHSHHAEPNEHFSPSAHNEHSLQSAHDEHSPHSDHGKHSPQSSHDHHSPHSVHDEHSYNDEHGHHSHGQHSNHVKIDEQPQSAINEAHATHDDNTAHSSSSGLERQAEQVTRTGKAKTLHNVEDSSHSDDHDNPEHSDHTGHGSHSEDAEDSHSDHDVHPYPLTELIICAGVFLIYFIEELISKVIGGHGSHGSHGHSHIPIPSRTTHSHKNGKVHNHEYPGYKKKFGSRGAWTPTHIDGIENPAFAEDSDAVSWNSVNKLDPNFQELPRRYSSNPPSVSTTETVEPPSCSQILLSNVRSVLMVLALSFHSTFEGLAIGLQQNAPDVLYLTLAVAAHKLVIHFSVSLELLTIGVSTLSVLLYTFVMAMTNPIGGVLGMFLTSDVAHFNDPTQLFVIAVLQALAAGTILYVVFFEIMERERGKQGSQMTKFFAFFLGFAFLAVIENFGGHSHGPDESGHNH